MSVFSHRYAIETNLHQNVAKKKSFTTESSKLAKLSQNKGFYKLTKESSWQSTLYG